MPEDIAMVKVTEEIKESLKGTKIAFLATASKDETFAKLP